MENLCTKRCNQQFLILLSLLFCLSSALILLMTVHTATFAYNLGEKRVEVGHDQSNLLFEHKPINVSLKNIKQLDKGQFIDGQLAEDKTVSSDLQASLDLANYEKRTVLATGYTAGYESTGKHPDHPQFGITYSGLEVKRDLYSTIAADLSVFPLGTILFIPGYGYGVVADKGGAIKGNKLDLYYDTVEQVYDEWGKKEVEVYLIEMGDGKLTEERLAKLNNDESMQVFRHQILNSYSN